MKLVKMTKERFAVDQIVSYTIQGKISHAVQYTEKGASPLAVIYQGE